MGYWAPQAELRQSLFDESRRREEGEEGDKQAEDAACEGLVNSHAAEVFPSPSSFSKGTKSLASEEIFKKGTSRRIWGVRARRDSSFILPVILLTFFFPISRPAFSSTRPFFVNVLHFFFHIRLQIACRSTSVRSADPRRRSSPAVI